MINLYLQNVIMNKKKIQLLIDFFMVVAASVLLILSITNVVSGDSKPSPDSYINLIGLLLPVIIFASLVLIIYWSVRKSFIVLLPLISLTINFNSVLGIIQIRLEKSDSEILNSTSVKVATYNIHEFLGKEDISLVSNLAEFIKSNNMDIVCFQEYKTPYSINKDELNSYFDFLPYYFIKDSDMAEIGMAIFSRYPILRSKRVDFENTGNGIIWADLQINSKKVFRIINNHLQTTNYKRNSNANISEKIELLQKNAIIRAHQAEAVRAIIDTTTIPVIVCGDFNDIPNSYTFNKIKGDNLIDGFREGGSGFGGTFRGTGNLLRIDYIFHSKHFKSVQYKCDKKNWSDHNPVISALEFKN